MKRTGKKLNDSYQTGAKHALYRVDGRWYHELKEFPGALFDGDGYVLFPVRQDYQNCPQLSIDAAHNQVHVDGGIASIPGYVKLNPPPLHAPLPK